MAALLAHTMASPLANQDLLLFLAWPLTTRDDIIAMHTAIIVYSHMVWTIAGGEAALL